MKSVEPYEEVKELTWNKCKHTDIKFVEGELKCKCGAAWGGSRLGELHKHLTT